MIIMSEKDSKNKETINEAVETLNQVASNLSTPKNIRKNISDMANGLKSEEFSLSVRASNAISLLDDITHDPNMPSYVRVNLWQAVSTLERIRE